jgi:FkbM family methyltransferase
MTYGAAKTPVTVSPMRFLRSRSGDVDVPVSAKAGRASTLPATAAQKARARAAETAEGEEREAFFGAAGSFTPYVAVESRGGALFFVRTDDTGIGRRLFKARNRREMKVLASAIGILRELGIDTTGGCFVDVGANIGTTTVEALTVHGFESALAIEPAADNYRLLRINVAANGLEERVVALQAALSEHEGELTLDVSSGDSGSYRIISEPDSSRMVTVTARTLDRLCTERVIEADCVTMLWMDVEGHEGHVLSGAGMLLDRGVPLVMELRPLGLAQQDGTARVVELVRRHYTHVLDLRRKRSHGRGELLPIGRIAQFIDDLGPHALTDVLGVRLPTS